MHFSVLTWHSNLCVVAYWSKCSLSRNLWASLPWKLSHPLWKQKRWASLNSDCLSPWYRWVQKVMTCVFLPNPASHDCFGLEGFAVCVLARLWFGNLIERIASSSLLYSSPVNLYALQGILPCQCLSAMGVQSHNFGPSPLKHGFMCQFFLNI